VAYADFVTAMMAFFLLMWLLNVTTKVQKQGIADYFAPAQVSESTSGAGGILGGTSLGDDNSKSSGSASVVQNAAPQASDDQALHRADSDQMKPDMQDRDSAAFASAAESIRQALNSRPDLAELSKQVLVDPTPEGLKIQLVDQDGRSMFDKNSAMPNDRAKILLRAVAGVINRMPNRIAIYGHTSANDGGPSDIAADRSLSGRRAENSANVLASSGVQQDRISFTAGKGSSEPLFPDDPTLAGNRRIAVVLLREAPVLPTPGT
jgi:chemotaxis protein MotB